MTLTVDVKKMFSEFQVVSLHLMGLAADRPLYPLDGLELELSPMEIKTIVATVSWRVPERK